MADDWDPFADPAETIDDAKPLPSINTKISVVPKVCDKLLYEFESGKLEGLREEYRQMMCEAPNGPEIDFARDLASGSRSSGVPMPFGPKYVPLVGEGTLPKLLLYGDSITHASPVCLSAPFCTAVAQKNAETLIVENAGWGGLMAVMMSEPSNFLTSFGPLPLLAPSNFDDCQYACILIGTNDAMAMCAPKAWTNMFKTVKGLEKPPDGGPPRLPEDWETSCPPSVELFEKNLKKFVRDLMATTGATVAIATPPMLGEDLTDMPRDKKMQKSPFIVMRDLAASVHRVAEAVSCDVLPLFECMTQHLKSIEKSGREPIPWTHSNFGKLMMETMQHPKVKISPLEDLGAKDTRPVLCYDLVHFNETGGAIYAALIQAWLDFHIGT